jgi:hypothetical protein
VHVFGESVQDPENPAIAHVDDGELLEMRLPEPERSELHHQIINITPSGRIYRLGIKSHPRAFPVNLQVHPIFGWRHTVGIDEGNMWAVDCSVAPAEDDPRFFPATEALGKRAECARICRRGKAFQSRATEPIEQTLTEVQLDSVIFAGEFSAVLTRWGWFELVGSIAARQHRMASDAPALVEERCMSGCSF